jgi:hypothetical protein
MQPVIVGCSDVIVADKVFLAINPVREEKQNITAALANVVSQLKLGGRKVLRANVHADTDCNPYQLSLNRY